MPHHPITTNVVITTATFDGPDSVIADTIYGTDVPVKIVSHDDGGDPRSVTVKIGNKEFPVSEIEYLLTSVARHKAAVAAWNANSNLPGINAP